MPFKPTPGANVVRKYRKRPVEVEAIQYDGKNAEAVDEFTGGVEWKTIAPPLPVIKTLEGYMTGSVGDYIVKGTHGEFYPVKPEIFEANNELVEENGSGEETPPGS